MADALNLAGSLLTIVTSALQSTRSLADTISRYKVRDKTLNDLLFEVEGMSKILQSLQELIATDSSATAIIKGPVLTCSKLCSDFEKSLQKFSGNSKVGFRDWTKMEFKKAEIDEFKAVLQRSKLTLVMGVSTINLQRAKVIRKFYNQNIKMNSNNLLKLRCIEDKMALLEKNYAEISDAQGKIIDLKNEKAENEDRVLISQDARSDVDSLTEPQEPSEKLSQLFSTDSDLELFKAQELACETLEQYRDNIIENIGRVKERLESLAPAGTPQNEFTKLRLQQELKESSNRLDLCKMASDPVAPKKVFTIGEVIAEQDSDQIIVTTQADVFDVKRAVSMNGSAQWIGSFSDETMRYISADRYRCRFPTKASPDSQPSTTTDPPAKSDSSTVNNVVAQQVEEIDNLKSTAWLLLLFLLLLLLFLL